MKIKMPRKISTHKILLVLSFVIVLLAGVGVLTYSNLNATETRSRDDGSQPSSSDGSISPQPANNDTSKQSTGVTDNRGVGVSAQPEGLASSSGQITLYEPRENRTISENSLLEGAASVPEVSYRLKDTTHGVISQGTLTVKEGFFSGTIHANTDAKSGTLEVFNLDSNGREVNHIEIVIRY